MLQPYFHSIEIYLTPIICTTKRKDSKKYKGGVASYAKIKDEPDIHDRIRAIERIVNNDIGFANCSFHFMVHEFEGFLFSMPKAFRKIADEDVAEKVQQIRDSVETPEHINNSIETAPSKRLKSIMPSYSKVRHGAIISQNIGIDNFIAECPHFKNWIEEIKMD